MTALQIRNEAWANAHFRLIPAWVRNRSIGLDQHNTQDTVAKYCWECFQSILKNENKNLSKYKIIEPSAGTGSFYNLLPESNRIGIDVERFAQYENEYLHTDFLTWNPAKKNKYVAIGNPPFGYRGWLALSFLNHAAEFCDYVGFILPMSFQSDGKGSPKYRVKGMTLIHHEVIPDGLFITNSGNKTNVNTLWQIWKKGGQMKAPDLNLCDEYIELFTVDQRKERLCGQEKMKDCKIFLQRTFYTEPPCIVDSFSKVKYCCGYGFIIKKDKEKILNLLKKADWVKYSNLATHNCRHISMYHIKQFLLDRYILKQTNE